MIRINLNTQQLINNLTGENKAWVEETEHYQETRFGNTDVFSVTIGEWSSYQFGVNLKVMIELGESFITFFFDYKGEIVDTNGNGQGSRYQPYLEKVAQELWSKFQDL